MANGNRRLVMQSDANVEPEEQEFVQNDSEEDVESEDEVKRVTIDDQPPHSIKIITTVGRVFEHRQIRHGFDGDDLIVLSTIKKVSYLYPKQNILQIVVTEG